MANAQFFQYSTIQKLFVLTGVVSIIFILAATSFVKYVPRRRQERYLTAANEFYSLWGRDSTIKHKPVLQVHCKKLIPYSLPLYKSMTYMSLSFDFVHSLFNNFMAIHLYQFFLSCEIPEEHFYATVYMIPNIPGGYNPNTPKRYFFHTDNYFWRIKEYVQRHGKQCSGIIVHGICIVDVGDVKSILQSTDDGQNALFHNKYLLEYDHTIMECMEERIAFKNVLEFFKDEG